jgi:predicted kinase
MKTGRRRISPARAEGALPHTIFLISPANLSGERGALILNPKAAFPLAERLRSLEGAPLGQVFSFVSGLYFRGKMAYAEAFGRAPAGLSAGLVISPAEGLRFLHEPVTVSRLRAWAEVPIDEQNPMYTGPLVEHAAALEQALGGSARFVLLGSVATDKYVEPLGAVFGARLLFPADFVGRGDMSRGAMLLAAVRTGVELVYAPVVGAERHGRRPARGSHRQRSPAAPREAAPPTALELVILIGLPGAGKSTFRAQRFDATHEVVSKDALKLRRAPERLHDELVQRALAAGRSVVVDSTNVSLDRRQRLIAIARSHGARVLGYAFEATARECVARNALREGVARIPNIGIFAAAKRLVRPSQGEGFDELYRVYTLPELAFDVHPDAPSASY